MEIVMIDRQLKKFWLADAEKGWSSVVGNVATVKNIEIGIHAGMNMGDFAMFFTELSSGANIRCVILSPDEVVNASTEQAYLQLASAVINDTIIPAFEKNSAKLNKSIENARNKIVPKFGEHPAITNYIREEK
ncbi:hypothetical protein RIU76_06410 [Latilactobacillus sakei subsp. sakei]|uniref:hypothetical protein n=1 Tax=Latilactobacillus sakei TaxID=1599 RepID=UPI002861D800|nr:hypothetical protein [Latilactobacillus sakei]MDR7924357.1 hypothetical protein [Latilactobacillus sakei subsp. sakei]